MNAYAKKLVIALLLLALILPTVAFAGGQAEGKKEGTIKYWHGYPEYDVVWKDIAAKDFMAKYPTVKVEVSSFPLRDFEKKLALALPAGSGPDLFFLSLPYLIKYIDAGLVDKSPAAVMSFVKKSFVPLWQVRATYKDAVWGIPYNGELKGAYWNVSMYQEAGLNRAPKNWAEMIDFAKKTTKYDASGNVVRSGVSLRLSGSGSGIAEKFWMWLMPAGGTIAEAGKQLGKYHAGYDNEAGRATLKLYIDLLYKHKVDSANIKHDSEAFALEQTAYFQREAWVIGYMKEHAPNVKYDTAPLPVEKRAGGMLESTNLNVSGKSTIKALAWEFALFLSEEKYLKEIIEKVGWLPCRTDVDYSDIYKKEPRFKSFMTIPEGYVGEPYPYITTSDEIYTKLADRLVPAYQDKSLLDNPAGIAKVIAEAAKQTNDILKEAGEYGE